MFNLLRAVTKSVSAVVSVPIKLADRASRDNNYFLRSNAGEELEKALNELLKAPIDAIEDAMTDRVNKD